jgi:hypothetical protein
VAVSEPGEGNGLGEQPPEGAGVLSNLPRTRPQRASARRAAARRTGEQDSTPDSGNGRSAAAPRKPAARSGTRAAASAAASEQTPVPRRAKARPKPAKAKRARKQDDVPRQGFESVEERATGPVQPPGGAELAGTAVEVVSELAKAGISGGERIVRDLLSRLGR